MKYCRISFAVSVLLFLSAVSPTSAGGIAVTANFASPTGMTAGPFSYGLDAFQAFDPSIAGSPGNANYKANVEAMGAGILRYANAAEMETNGASGYFGWIANVQKKPCALSEINWDASKIADAVKGSYAYGRVRMVDIENWPSCAAENNRLIPSQYSAYAAFCAKLVKILNVDNKLGVKYFEVFNELDNTNSGYHGDMATAAQIYNLVVPAMKAVDPTIKVGGPAFTTEYASSPDLDDFFSVAAPNLDFVTYHNYAYCHPQGQANSTGYVYDQAAYTGATTFQIMKSEFAKYSTNTPQFFLDEFNMNGCGTDARQAHVQSAIFDALVMINAVDAGASGTMAWNDADNSNNYGKLTYNRTFARRPSSYLYQVLNADMQGPVYKSTPGPTAPTIIPLAIKSSSAFIIELVNRSSASQTIELTLSGLANLTPTSQITVNQVGASGWSTLRSASYSALSGGYAVAGSTITFLSIPLSVQ